MNKTSYDCIKRILLTEKAQKLLKTQNKIVVEIPKEVNKSMIKQAVMKIWSGIIVKKVGIINVPGRSKRLTKNRFVVLGAHKKAIVTVYGSLPATELTDVSNVVVNKS